MNAAIAQHLNVTEAAIVRVEEWANVLFVVVKKLGARFVSKKVTETVTEFDFEAELERMEKEQDELSDKADRVASEIMDHLPQWAADSAEWSNLRSAAIEIINGHSTFDEAVTRFASKRIIKK